MFPKVFKKRLSIIEIFSFQSPFSNLQSVSIFNLRIYDLELIGNWKLAIGNLKLYLLSYFILYVFPQHQSCVGIEAGKGGEEESRNRH